MIGLHFPGVGIALKKNNGNNATYSTCFQLQSDWNKNEHKVSYTEEPPVSLKVRRFRDLEERAEKKIAKMQSSPDYGTGKSI